MRLIDTVASIWRENMHGYLFKDIICSEMQTIFRERSSRDTVSFELLSADINANYSGKMINQEDNPKISYCK